MPCVCVCNNNAACASSWGSTNQPTQHQPNPTPQNQVKPASPSFRRGVLMGDWNDANILVDPQAPERVVGATDFGDATYR